MAREAGVLRKRGGGWGRARGTGRLLSVGVGWCDWGARSACAQRKWHPGLVGNSVVDRPADFRRDGLSARFREIAKGPFGHSEPHPTEDDRLVECGTLASRFIRSHTPLAIYRRSGMWQFSDASVLLSELSR